MANAQFKAEYYAGRDLAQAMYLVDATGTQIAGNANPLPVSQIVGGLPIGATNAEINISNIQQLILQGQGFTGCTGKLTAGAGEQVGAALFANAIAKNMLVYSLRVYVSANANVQTNFWTANDVNLTQSVSLANANDKAGGAAPLAAMTYVNAAVVASGVQHDFSDVNANVIFDLLPGGKFYYFPAGIAGGVAVYPTLSGANVWAVTFSWVEF